MAEKRNRLRPRVTEALQGIIPDPAVAVGERLAKIQAAFL